MFWKRKQPFIEGDATAIGRILLDMGAVTEEKLAEAAAKKVNGTPLGQILVAMEAITAKQLDEALLKQKVMRGTSKPRETTEFALNAERHAANKARSSLDEMVSMSNHLVNGMRTKPRLR